MRGLHLKVTAISSHTVPELQKDSTALTLTTDSKSHKLQDTAYDRIVNIAFFLFPFCRKVGPPTTPSAVWIIESRVFPFRPRPRHSAGDRVQPSQRPLLPEDIGFPRSACVRHTTETLGRPIPHPASFSPVIRKRKRRSLGDCFVLQILRE